jgi:glycosyltransferase involved in cell wall biosynthesis
VTSGLLLDVSAAVNQRAGIGRYARGILSELLPHLPECDIRLWYAADQEPSGFLAMSRFDSVEKVRAPTSRLMVDRLLFRGRLPVGALMRVGNPRVAYSPDFTVPKRRKTLSFITIHDVAWEIVPHCTPRHLRSFLSHVVPAAARQATTIFTVSESTRHDIRERLLITPERIQVARGGVDEAFFGAKALCREDRHLFRIPNEYILMVGTIEPRKNHIGALRALSIPGVDLPLVIVGRRGWEWEPVVETISRLHLGSRAHEVGFLPDHLLPSVYASASVVLYPSWYEGFGLPVLEGLASGAPVVASDLPVFREIGDGHIEFVDPANPESIASGIQQALRDRADCPAKGAARISKAREYRWAPSARIVADELLTWT